MHTLFFSGMTHMQCPHDVRQVQQYLRLVVEGKLPVNHDIVYELQVRQQMHQLVLRSCTYLTDGLCSQRSAMTVMADGTADHLALVRSLQDAFNLLPNMNVDKLSRSFAVKSNDMMLVIYLSSMVRSVLAMHDLIDNREGGASVPAA
jgi:Maintenance of mitochondrial structure and function